VEDGPEVLESDQTWRIIYGASILLEVAAIILVKLIVTAPSLKDAIQTDSGFTEISKVYKVRNNDDITKIKVALSPIEEAKKEEISLGEAFLSSKYRFAHWNSVFICFMSSATGISFIVFFTMFIFQEMKKEGQFDMSIPLAV